MEPKLRSSFIPKKDVSISSNSGGGSLGYGKKGLLDKVSMGLFGLALVLWAGLFGYQKYVEASITDVEKQVIDARSRIDSSRVDQFRSLGKQIEASKILLNQHVFVTPVFDALEELTLPSVQFIEFNMSLTQRGFLVEAQAVASNFAAVDLQKNILEESDTVADVSVFDIALTEKTGGINFSVQFTVPRDEVLYVKIVENMIAESVPTSTPQPVGEDGEDVLDENIINQILNEEDLDSLLLEELESL